MVFIIRMRVVPLVGESLTCITSIAKNKSDVPPNKMEISFQYFHKRTVAIIVKTKAETPDKMTMYAGAVETPSVFVCDA